MVRGDSRSEVGRCRADEIDGRSGGDVLQHHAQAGELTHQWFQMALDKHRFAVEGIDVR